MSGKMAKEKVLSQALSGRRWCLVGFGIIRYNEVLLAWGPILGLGHSSGAAPPGGSVEPRLLCLQPPSLGMLGKRDSASAKFLGETLLLVI